MTKEDFETTIEFLRDCRNDSIMDDITEAVNNTLPLLEASRDLLEALEAVEKAMMAEQGFIPNFMASALKNARGIK